MEQRRGFAAVLAFCILSNAFSLPIDALRFGRYGPLNYRSPFLLMRIPAIQNNFLAQNERFTRQNEVLAHNPSPLPLQTEVKTSVPLVPAGTVIIPPEGPPAADATKSPPTTTTLEPKTNEYDKKTETSTTKIVDMITDVTHTTEPKQSQSKDEASTASIITNESSTKELNQKPTVAPMNPDVTLTPNRSDYRKQRKHYQTTESIDDLENVDTISTSSSTSNGGGSDLFSLLNFASGLFPASSGANKLITKMMKYFFPNNGALFINRRTDVSNNSIEVDNVALKPPPPPLQRQEDNDSSNGSSNSSEASESNENGSKDNAEEVNIEEINTNASQQTSDSNDDDSNSDSNEIPDGDGQGGGILGILAGLSGEDGQSDLGSLLATVGGIIANLSGDGFDLNAVLGSGLGLLAGLLSEGEENPGSVIASYLLTSLDTITGGGANNNGAFFGNFISKLVKGTSAGVNEDGSDDDKEPMKDSAGFFASFLMSLLGNMSKGSSSGSSSHPW